MPCVTVGAAGAGGGVWAGVGVRGGAVRATTAPTLHAAATGDVLYAVVRSEAPALKSGAKLADPASNAASASRWKDECMPAQTARRPLTLPSRGRNDRVRPPVTPATERGQPI